MISTLFTIERVLDESVKLISSIPFQNLNGIYQRQI